MTRRFDGFVNDLAATRVGPRACNQFSRESGDAAGNAVRRRNLRLYLDELATHEPDTMLVGEAVSYRGGRLTGIAFVSESVMLAGVDTPRGHVLGADRGYRKATPGPRLSTEASATIVWGTIRTLDRLPLLWNAFPFHPFIGDDEHTNRAPSASELLIGQPFIQRLIRLFGIRQLIAVGNSASLSLTRLGLAHEKVRHPSQGGKTLFVDGVARLSHSSQS